MMSKEKLVKELRRKQSEVRVLEGKLSLQEKLEGRVLSEWAKVVHDLCCFDCVSARMNRSEKECGFQKEYDSPRSDLIAEYPMFHYWTKRARELILLADKHKVSMEALLEILACLENRDEEEEGE